MMTAAEFFDLELLELFTVEAEASDSMLSLSLFCLRETLVTSAGKSSLHSLSNIIDRAEAMSGVFVNEQHHEHVMMLTSTNQVY